jgi:hypothetical protein
MLEIFEEIRPRNAERAELRDRVIFWLGIVCLAILVALATNAHAGTKKYESRGGTILFLDKPCELDLKEKAKLRAATGTFTIVAPTPFGLMPLGQADFKGCWKHTAEGYETEWEDGEKITFPQDEVHPEGV